MAFSSSKTIKASEIQQHNKVDDIWIVVNGRVYDMTRFAPEHPGGVEIIYSYAGRDASQAYNEIHEPNLIRANLRPEEILGDLDPTTSFPEASTTSSGSAVPPKEGEKPPLETLLNLNDFEEAAQHSISKKSWAFISGASNDNITRDANKNFYQKIWFRPRILKNVAEVSTKASMMGCNVSLPLWISPTGIGKAGGPEGEIALSKAASETGIIQTVRMGQDRQTRPVLRVVRVVLTACLVLCVLDINQRFIPAGRNPLRSTWSTVLFSVIYQQGQNKNRRALAHGQQ